MFEVLAYPDECSLYTGSYEYCRQFILRYTKSGNWGGWEQFDVVDWSQEAHASYGINEEGRAQWNLMEDVG